MTLRLSILFLTVVVLTSCSEYNRILKETDISKKYAKAVEYYEKGDCYKALPLLEELIGLTRGTQMAEDVYYYYAKTEYCIKDYYLANYYFKTFTKTFSQSPRAEECQYLAALCRYKLSPEHSLDPTDTQAAIADFQLFLDKYPNSPLRAEANEMVRKLNAKLELKAFEIARLYYRTEKYKAAVQALGQYIKDYPISPYREEAQYLMVRSSFLYAEGSIEARKLERYRAAADSYITFASAYPQSTYLADAEQVYEKCRKAIERLTREASN